MFAAFLAAAIASVSASEPVTIDFPAPVHGVMRRALARPVYRAWDHSGVPYGMAIQPDEAVELLRVMAPRLGERNPAGRVCRRSHGRAWLVVYFDEHDWVSLGRSFGLSPKVKLDRDVAESLYFGLADLVEPGGHDEGAACREHRCSCGCPKCTCAEKHGR